MEKESKITQYRERLDKTLASPDLKNGERLKTLVKDQLLHSTKDETKGLNEKVIEKRTAEVSNFLDMLRSTSVNDNEGLKASEKSHAEWKLKQDNEEYRVLYREGPQGTPFHSLLVEGYVEGPVDVCLCISCESSLYKKWWPQSTIPTFKIMSCKCLQRVRIGEQISLVRMKLSWPLSSREAVVHYFLFEYFQDDLIVVLLNTISDSEDIDMVTHGFTGEAIPEAEDVVRIDVVGGYALQKVTPERSYFRTNSNWLLHVTALNWLRIDYHVSIKYLPEKHLLPTCQSLGELYLRLEDFNHALIYQKKHLELAKDANDLVEQQRASTQLGRTYHEMFLRSEVDHLSVRNAKKYYKSAMKLAETLKRNPPDKDSNFLKEYVDAHNNLGLVEMDLDNFEEALKILSMGLKICDEEEVDENDDGRSRLYHNLGKVYMDLRMWVKARENIEKDIMICKKIGHCQGEAKGYINLGELHYRVQRYEEALRCYQRGLDLANSMEDEDALVRQIDDNIEIVKEAIKVMDELKKEEQNLKKLTRDMVVARGTPRERKCLLNQYASLDCLAEKSREIFDWLKLCEYGKRKKRVASELCDKEKLSDSFLDIGESYQKLRKVDRSINLEQEELGNIQVNWQLGGIAVKVYGGSSVHGCAV
ncbi:hypothetical protein SO802_002515 [Lithocarpus litseifolius]|uniref:Uncharacterized protein n=1 Tax=Lithocarpus litseifolius TaxID=425828 RepID=A0AAW2DYD3_9ROSI